MWGYLQAQSPRKVDGKNRNTGRPDPPEDPEYAQFAIFEQTAKRAEFAAPSESKLPLRLNNDEVIALIGNTLLDRTRHFGYIESMLHQAHPKRNLVVRNLSWPADTPSLQPRPMNFADLDQHLTHVEADVIFAAFGFNESFQGEAGLEAFRQSLSSYLTGLRSRAFNGHSSA